MEVSGNLVTHILVSPFYHARKKVSCSVCVCWPLHLLPSQIPPKHQWYLFNDFAITPVDEVCTVQVVQVVHLNSSCPPPLPVCHGSVLYGVADPVHPPLHSERLCHPL